MLGYVASVALKSLQLSAIREQELALQGLWTQRKVAGAQLLLSPTEEPPRCSHCDANKHEHVEVREENESTSRVLRAAV